MIVTFWILGVAFLNTFAFVQPSNYVIPPPLSETVRKECEGTSITYLGVETKYPLTVAEAKEEYDLKYWQPYAFYKTVSALPQLSLDVKYNFDILYPREEGSTFRDNTPEETWLEKPVKGYTFYFRGSTDTDSLKTALEKQFVSKFVQKANKATRAINMKRGLFYHEMKISDCLHIAMSDYGPQKMLIMLCFYFDIPEEERSWFPH
jgi:hypothetical protein